MMHKRHLTQEEKQTLLRITEEASLPEAIRCLGGIVAHNHPNLQLGQVLRNQLFHVAEDVQAEPDA